MSKIIISSCVRIEYSTSLMQKCGLNWTLHKWLWIITIAWPNKSVSIEKYCELKYHFLGWFPCCLCPILSEGDSSFSIKNVVPTLVLMHCNFSILYSFSHSHSYLTFSSICARLVRRCLKPDLRVEALKREESLMKTVKWEGGKQVGEASE